jgi:hypothetical protein
MPKKGTRLDHQEVEPDIATRIMERMVRMPPKQHKDMKLGKSKARAVQKANRPEAAHIGAMIVFDVETLPNGDVAIGKPYKRLPDGTVAALIAS